MQKRAKIIIHYAVQNRTFYVKYILQYPFDVVNGLPWNYECIKFVTNFFLTSLREQVSASQTSMYVQA